MNHQLTNKDIKKQSPFFNNQQEFATFFKSLPLVAFIVNDSNQVVLYSDTLKEYLNIENEHSITGISPCDLFKCNNENCSQKDVETSTDSCKCGIKKAIFRSRAQNGPVNEPYTPQLNNGKFSNQENIVISASPLYTSESNYTLVYLDERNKILQLYAHEDSFLHELLDKVGNLSGAIDLAEWSDDDELKNEGLKIIRNVTQLMQEEILEHKELLAVVRGSYKPVKEPFIVDQLIDSIKNQVEQLFSPEEQTFEFEKKNIDLVCNCDQTLLRRVIIYCIKTIEKDNTKRGNIHINYDFDDQQIVFNIRNSSYLPLLKQLIYFQNMVIPQSKNTYMKSYRIRRITEQFLGGHISFQTDKPTGTVISIHLPLS